MDTFRGNVLPVCLSGWMGLQSSSDLQSLEKREQSGVTTQPTEVSSTMGIKDNDYVWRGEGDNTEIDLHSEGKPGSFNQHTPCTTPETDNSENSLRLQSTSLGDSTVSVGDDGVNKGQKGGNCEDDEEGHLVYEIGLVMNERYEVVSTLGAGAFGKVVECVDRDKDEHVAVKIVRNIECFREVARSEIAVLEEINMLDDDNKFACVRMLNWFEHNGHICIVFELLGLSTFEFLQQNKFLPFSVGEIRHMAFQIFRAVCFLHRNKLTHTDLKPENILFVSSGCNAFNDETERKLRSLDVKVVDFGTATFDHEHHESLVSTRHYRAPEYMRRENEDERQLFDLLSCMLEYDVCRRITLEEALWHPFFSPLRTQRHQRNIDLPVKRQNMAANCIRTSFCQKAYTRGLISELDSPSSHR
ncbi:hypothetical protein INR49_027662 [Caranx melampygus]|nr:hypothetical protein INR49_027662 [Caranx melampygus]